MCFDVLNTCDPDNMQQRGNVGEAARRAERHPGVRGGLPQRARHPADGNFDTHAHTQAQICISRFLYIVVCCWFSYAGVSSHVHWTE